MEYGSTSPALRRQLERAGLLDNKIFTGPDLDDGLVFYVEAFARLSSDRLIEMGPIPTMAILNYALYYDLTREEESDLLFFIRKMDSVFLSHMDEKRKKEMESKSKK